MDIVVVGVNHQTAPLAVRERLAFTPASLPEALRQLRTVVPEGFILSTCNRTEIYALVEAASEGAAAVAAFLAAFHQTSVAAIWPHLAIENGAAAVRHCFGVAAGLDSVVLGEDQIMTQVKAAVDAAQAAGALGPALHRLGQAALAAGKAVRTDTLINHHHLSVVSVGLRLAGAGQGQLRDRAVLVVGAGDTAELTLKHLAGLDLARLAVVNRTDARAAALAARHGGRALPWRDLAGALAEADLVISCTSALEPVIAADLAARALARRPTRPLVCLDLAVPRDIAPEVAALPGVTLYHMDHIQAVCADNHRQRLAAVTQAAALVETAVDDYLGWWQARAVAPTIAALHARAEAIREAELERALARLGGLDERSQTVVRALAAGIVNKLLHQPVATLKSAPDGVALAQVTRQLFGLS